MADPADLDADLGLHLQYHVKTELFDRSLPGLTCSTMGRDQDTWLPDDLARSSRYASALRTAQQHVRATLQIKLRPRDDLLRSSHAANLRMLVWHMDRYPAFWTVAMRLMAERLSPTQQF